MVPVSDDEFAALMAPLGPWAGLRRIGVAVSGGADSLACAVLVQRWAVPRGVAVIGLVIDHGLRSGSDTEATLTVRRLDRLGIAARQAGLDGLRRGPALAERARTARYAALTRLAAALGLLDLVFGHHANDQAETVLMRERAGSGPDGLSGMALLRETSSLRLLRPLLCVPAARLRATLRQAGQDWIEDPSNRDQRALRTRLRGEVAASPDLDVRLCAQAARAGQSRMAAGRQRAALLAARAVLRPEGFAILPPDLLRAADEAQAGAGEARALAFSCLAALIRIVAGRDYPPSSRQVLSLLDRPRAATLAGTRLVPAGRLGAGWLLVREARAVTPALPAGPGALWDGRFRLRDDWAHGAGEGWTVGPQPAGSWSADGVTMKRRPRLPRLILSTLPCLRDAAGRVVAGEAAFDFAPSFCASDGAVFQTLPTAAVAG